VKAAAAGSGGLFAMSGGTRTRRQQNPPFLVRSAFLRMTPVSEVSRPPRLGRIALGVGIASLATIPLMLVLAPIGGLFGWRPPIAYELAFGGVLLLMPLLAISAVAMGHITVRRNKADGSAKMALAIGYAVLGLTVLVIGLWFVWELAMTR